MYHDDTSHLYLGYHPEIHDIWRYNVGANKFLETIGLKYRGEDGYAELASILYHNADSLFLLEIKPDRLWVMNPKTRLRNLLFDFSERIKEDPRFKDVILSRSPENSAPLFIYNKKIYFSLRSDVSSADYSFPLLGFYDLSADSMGIVKIYFPDEYKDVDYGFFKSPNILFSQGRLVVSFPISTDYYIYDLDGILQRKIRRLQDLAVPRPLEAAEDQHDHYETQPHLHATELFCGGKYILQAGGSSLHASLEDPGSQYVLIYDQDFRRVQIIRESKRLWSFGGAYLYYPISPENSEIQYLERYKVVEPY